MTPTRNHTENHTIKRNMENTLKQKIARTLIRVATMSNTQRWASGGTPYIYLSNTHACASDGALLIAYDLQLPALGADAVYIDAQTLRGICANGDVAVDGTHLTGFAGYRYPHYMDNQSGYKKIMGVLQSLFSEWLLESYHVEWLSRTIKKTTLSGSKRVHILAVDNSLFYMVEFPPEGVTTLPQPLPTAYNSPIKQQGHLIFTTDQFRLLLSCGGHGRSNLLLWRRPDSPLCGLGLMGDGYIALATTIIDKDINQDEPLTWI